MTIEPPGNLAPTVEVDAPGLFLPLEILPLLGTDWPPFDGVPSISELERRAHWFVGMSAVVRRTLRLKDGLDQDLILTSVPRLPIKLFYHAGLAGAGKELVFFRKKNDRIA